MNPFKKKPIGTMTIQEGLPDSIHKDAATILGKGLIEENLSAFEKLLDENATWIFPQTGKETIAGRNHIVAYWKDWVKRIGKEQLEVEFEVKFCSYYAMTTLSISPKGFASSYILFYIKDGLIHTGISARAEVAHVKNSMENFEAKYESLNNIPFTMEFVEKHITSPKEPQTDCMPCPHCGKVSEELIWQNVKFILGAYDYTGNVATCPDCNKVVLFYPESTIKRDESSQIPIKEQDELWVTNFQVKLDQFFCQPLKGSKYLDKLSKENTESAKVSTGRIGCTQDVKESLYDIAAIFDTSFLTIFYMRDYDKYEQIKNCYATALADGIYEAANNLGILVYSIEEFDKERGLNYFKTALEHGSKAGYLNYIFTCWIEEKYEQIKGLLTSNNGFNSLANEGKLFQDLLKTGVFNCDGMECTDTLHEFLPAIKTEKSWILCIHMASEEWFGGHGDQSRFFITDKSKEYYDPKELCIVSESIMNFDIYEHIVMPRFEEAIWQLYLLMKANCVLPFFWHGGYSQRTYIWSSTDFNQIDVLKNRDMSSIAEKDFIKPSVEFEDTPDGFIAHVYCCYWNNWEGLVREHIIMRVVNSSIVEYLNGAKFVIYPYHCGTFY